LRVDSATGRLLGVDVARVYRLARQGKLGKVIHPETPGQEAAVPVAAVERYALRIFSDKQIENALERARHDHWSYTVAVEAGASHESALAWIK
jgi:hypothetical protein